MARLRQSCAHLNNAHNKVCNGKRKEARRKRYSGSEPSGKESRWEGLSSAKPLRDTSSTADDSLVLLGAVTYRTVLLRICIQNMYTRNDTRTSGRKCRVQQGNIPTGCTKATSKRHFSALFLGSYLVRSIPSSYLLLDDRGVTEG